MTTTRKPSKISKADWDSAALPPLPLSLMRKMRPASEVAPEIVAAYKRGRGRPAGRSKTVVSLSLDTEVLTALKASGKGWQTRVNDLLKAAVQIRDAS